MEWLIRGVALYGEERTNLLLRDGVIADVGSAVVAPKAQQVDADGLIALPGLVDVHTHLREPGGEAAETIATGSAAAALGGFTAICAMPNTSPVADSPAVVEYVYRRGLEVGLVDVQPIGAVTVGQEGAALAELGSMADSAACVRMFSDDGNCVSDPLVMRRALEYVSAFGGVIAQHAQEPRLTVDAQMHEGEVASRLGLAGWPAVAEESIIARDVMMAGLTGSRLHLCHVSTKGSVELLRWAKSKGWPVTAEVTPHHLLLTDEEAVGYDPVFKVNPPLRSAADVDAVRNALVEGVIDMVATDHAPHAQEHKECEWVQAKPGMLGLETAVAVAAELLVAPGLMTWRQLAERMSVAPAAMAQLDGHGRPLEVGEPANITLIDPEAPWVVEPNKLASRSRNTPYAGRELPARVVATFLRGAPSVLDGKVQR